MTVGKIACWLSAAVLTATALTGCTSGGASEVAGGSNEPAQVSAVDQLGQLHRVRLTRDAAGRIGLETAEIRPGVRKASSDGPHPLQVPVDSLIYDQQGRTWVYVQLATLTFQRAQVSLSRIDGELAVLLSGPPAGTTVATVGVAELRGAEEGVPGE